MSLQIRSSQPVGPGPVGGEKTLSQGLSKSIRKHIYLRYNSKNYISSELIVIK